MPILKVVRTHNRFAFDVISDAPSFHERQLAREILIHFKDTVESGCLRTYANVKSPVSIRHKFNISENIINRYHLQEGQELNCTIATSNDGIHLFTITDCRE